MIINNSLQQKMMQMLKRSSSNHLKRHTSATLIHNRAGGTIEHIISPPHSRITNISQTPSQNPKSVIEKLFKGDNLYSLKKISARVQLKNRKNILGETQERIFSEVIGLVGEIDDLRTKIATTHSQIRELQISHPAISEKVRFHGYEQRLTSQQCSQLEEESEKLINLIREAQQKQVGGLEDVLRIEKQKYDELKRDLAQDKPSDAKDIEERTKALKSAIQSLEAERSARLVATFPEFESIKQRNQLLRQKTLANLMHSKQLAEEQRLLQQCLRNDELNKEEYMAQLQEWKAEYNRLKNQNDSFKLRLIKKEKIESKENLSSNVFRQSKAASTKMLQLDSEIKKTRNDRLSEYSSLIKRMQSLKR